MIKVKLPEFNRWWIVFASAMSHMVGQGAINIFAAGVFIGPITGELGIGRGVLSSAIGLSSIMTAITVPLLGRFMDRTSVRPALLVSIIAFALATAAMSQLQPAFLFPLFAVSGICGAAQTATPYSKVVVGWFDRERGLALGIMLVGVGLGGVLAPQLAGFLVGAFGWRMAYAGLGLAIVLVAFVPTALFIRERPRVERGRIVELPGLSLHEAMWGSFLFWFMLAAFFLVSVGVNGVIIHVVPMLTDRGMPPAAATAILSVSGIAGMLSRIVAGYLMDKFHAPFVGIGFFFLPMIGIALFASGWGGIAPLTGMIGIGMGLGAEIDLMSFLIGRYFGLRAFGALHGLIFSAFLLGQAGGANVLGWSQQLAGSYVPGLMALEVLFAIACALLAVLGPYRYPAMGDSADLPEN